MKWYFAVYICGDSRYVEFGSLDKSSVKQYLRNNPGGFLYSVVETHPWVREI